MGKRHIKTFEEDDKLELLNGRYGPYIAYDGKNYRIPKAKQENVEALSYDECMTIIKEAPEEVYVCGIFRPFGAISAYVIFCSILQTFTAYNTPFRINQF